MSNISSPDSESYLLHNGTNILILIQYCRRNKLVKDKYYRSRNLILFQEKLFLSKFWKARNLVIQKKKKKKADYS